jgi:hypothetical protein
MTEGATIVHAYGVIGAGDPVPDLAGIAGSPVDVVAVSGLAVMFSHLPADLYGSASWDEHAEDIRWLGSVARGHQQVLDVAVALGDVVPFRLPSMYSCVDALRARVGEDRDQLESSLAAIAGRVEWGVKVYRDGAATDPHQPRAQETTGADYLRARSSALRERDDVEARRRELLAETHERLAHVSDDAVRNPVQDSALTGRSQQMLLNGAYLVRRDREQGFLDAVRSLADERSAQGLLVEPTGPWPAYNFVGKPLSKDGGDER